MRPAVVTKMKAQGDELALSMTEHLYFVPFASMSLAENNISTVYLIYRDKTTLPVLHKFQLSQQADSDLRRWEAVHLDTVFASSHKGLLALNTFEGCQRLFDGREG